MTTKTNRPGSWHSALTEYVIAMQAAKRSPGTIRVHRYYITALSEVTGSPWEVEPRELLAFLARPQWAPETTKSARGSLRGFFRWAHGSGYIADDPSLGLPTVTVPRAEARPAPEHLVRRLVAHRDRRIELMALLAAYGGLRAAEIAGVSGRDLVGDMLYVKGKGGKVRRVPIVDGRLLSRLQALGDEWAFPNGQGSHLSPGHVTRLMSREMPEGWTGHTLRHRMATVSNRNNPDLLALMRVLGHSRPETTQRYVQTSDDALRAVVAAASAG